MEVTEVKYFIEAALLAAARPLSVDQIAQLFDEASCPEKSELREAIAALKEEYEPRGIEIAEVASGFRMQVTSSMAERLEKLWEERPPRYSRALFETLALIAYRQPMTRGEIEEIRGVSVSSNIIRSLLERDWVRVVGHRDVPGRPAMFGTTRQFLDYFGLKKLDDLPPLADLSDWESLRVQLNLPSVEEEEDTDGTAANEDHAADAVVTPLSVAGLADADSDDNSDGEEAGEIGADAVSLAEQEAEEDADLEQDLAAGDMPITAEAELEIAEKENQDSGDATVAEAADDIDEEATETQARNG